LTVEKIADAFDKGSLTYDKAAFIHHQSALHFFEELKKHVNEPQTILDVGCGTGLLGPYIKRLYPKSHLTGIDISEGMIQKAILSKCYDELIINNALDYTQRYDLIVAHFSLQWFDDLKKIVDHLASQTQILAFVVPLETSFTSWKQLYPHVLYKLPKASEFSPFLNKEIYKDFRSYAMEFTYPFEFAKYLKTLGANFSTKSSTKMLPREFFHPKSFSTSYEVLHMIIKGGL
jgi:ubiquinone/menaquinone biosynthesis C-methylase UbiE